MHSGWRHDDPQSQREFERLRQRTVESTEEAAPAPLRRTAVPSGETGPSEGVEVGIRSPFETVKVEKVGQWWELERFFTVALNDAAVVSRGTRTDTVNRLNFEDTASVTWTITKGDDNEIVVQATATGGAGAPYSWFLDDAFAASTEITNGETVTFTGSGEAQVSRTGNTINVYVPTPTTYVWSVDTNSAGAQLVFASSTVNFVNGTGISITRTGLDITIASTVTAYSWSIQADANPAYSVPAAGTVQLVSGSNISLSQASGVITINAAAYPDYNWIASDGSTTTNVTDGATVTWVGAGPLTVVNSGGTFTITRPLTIEDDNVAVGASDTAFINFDSNGATTTGQAVNFVVTDDGSGQRTIKAYVPAGAGTYQWNFSVNGGATESVDNSDTLDLSAVNGTIVVARTGLNATLKSPLTIEDDNVAVGGDDTVALNFDSNGQTTTAVAVNFVVTDDGGGQRSVKAYVPAGGGAYDWRASDGGSPDTIASGETVTWTGGTGISVSYNAGTNTFTITNTAAYPGYHWKLAATAAGATTDINDAETVRFLATGTGLSVSRNNNEITYNHSIDTGTSGEGQRVKVGYVTWVIPEPGAPGNGRYGVKVYADIVHNWDLSNMHLWELYLEDVTFIVDPADPDYLDTPQVVDFYRDGATTIWGATLGNQVVRLKPYIQALDENTIRLWITHSQAYPVPTEMKMWYVLREA